MPAFSVVGLIKAIPAFVVTCPDDVLGGCVALVLILALRRVGTSADGGAGRIFW
jgi:hypothetical protein